MGRRTTKRFRDEKREAQAEILRSFDRAIAFGDGGVAVEVRAEGDQVQIFVHDFVRRRIDRFDVPREIRSALESILLRRPFGGINIEVIGGDIFVSYFVRRMYRTPAVDTHKSGPPAFEEKSIN